LQGVESCFLHVILLCEGLDVAGTVAQHDEGDRAASAHSFSVAGDGDFLSNEISAAADNLANRVASEGGRVPSTAVPHTIASHLRFINEI
jgi:hypothetical protein